MTQLGEVAGGLFQIQAWTISQSSLLSQNQQ
jgi:hypothetical protein